MIRFFGKTKIDFQGSRHVWMTFSAVVILIGLVSLILHGGPNYSIDFKGGLKIELRVDEPEGKQPISEDLVRGTLNRINLGNSEVKMTRSAQGENIIVQIKEEGRFKPPEALIRNSLESNVESKDWRVIPEHRLDPSVFETTKGLSFIAVETIIPEKDFVSALEAAAIDNPELFKGETLEGESILLLTGEGKDSASKLLRALEADFSEYNFEVRSIDRVGPRIGGELRRDALLAVLAALFLIVIYLWWRFELLFGIAAVIALFHDVLITLGIFSILNLEISLTVIGAFLTLVGYSLNDTIVVFDRIRENIKRYKDANYGRIINRSINDNLSRTVITSLTTLIVVLVLFFAGGEVLHSFSLALLVGILVGTYSSIYIASPILVEWAERTGRVAGSKKKKS